WWGLEGVSGAWPPRFPRWRASPLPPAPSPRREGGSKTAPASPLSPPLRTITCESLGVSADRRAESKPWDLIRVMPAWESDGILRILPPVADHPGHRLALLAVHRAAGRGRLQGPHRGTGHPPVDRRVLGALHRRRPRHGGAERRPDGSGPGPDLAGAAGGGGAPRGGLGGLGRGGGGGGLGGCGL